MRRLPALVPALLALLLGAPAAATPDDLRSLSGMERHARVLLVFAPTLGDPRLAAQRRALDRAALAMEERDLVLVQVAGDQVIGAHDDGARLRRRFRVLPGDYRTLLIGKDGHTAMAIVGPIAAAHLEARIDAMPMRQDEVRRARAGQGVRTQ